MQSPLLERIAGAPISWGICEVPGWGLQLGIARVLGEMRDAGFKATELGASGWLPNEPERINALLAEYGLHAMAAFVPLVLHDSSRLDDTLASAESTAALLEAVGASCFNTAVVSDPSRWERPELNAAEWKHLLVGLEQVDAITSAHGLTQVVHPHVDSLIEQADEVEQVLQGTDVKFCLDTGHLVIGGVDPLAFVTEHADRVGLVHLKDVRLSVVERLRRGELSLMEAVQAGVFTRLGDGDVALDQIVNALERAGYQGWYVFEQDAALNAGEPARGEGPIVDVLASVQYLRSLDAAMRQETRSS